MNNDMMLTYALIAVAAYLVGNINPSIIIGKIKGIDIRKEGSGNAGMTNTIRVMGFDAGLTVLFVDVFKGFISVYLGNDYGGSTGAMVAFAAVVLGHCFPVFFGFKGGKGVATSLGAALALNWLSAFAALLVAIVFFILTRRMSVASLFAALSYPALVWYYEPDYYRFAIGVAVFLVVMHTANLIRLAKGEEKPLTVGGSAKKDEEPSDAGRTAYDAAEEASEETADAALPDNAAAASEDSMPVKDRKAAEEKISAPDKMADDAAEAAASSAEKAPKERKTKGGKFKKKAVKAQETAAGSDKTIAAAEKVSAPAERAAAKAENMQAVTENEKTAIVSKVPASEEKAVPQAGGSEKKSGKILEKLSGLFSSLFSGIKGAGNERTAVTLRKGSALTEDELKRFRLSASSFEDMESGESHIAAEATRSPSLVQAQTQDAVRPEPEPVDYYADVLIPALGQDERRIAVIGSGSFGTSMANLLTYTGHEVTLYGRNKAALDVMKESRMNEKYLPYAILSERISYTGDLEEAVKNADIVVYAVPAQKFREVSAVSAEYLKKGVIAVNLAKGIELKTLMRMSEVAAETIPDARYVALSGPSHAEEIVRNMPASVVAASEDKKAAAEVQEAFMSENFRVYTQSDMIGVEIAGSVKNVIAITTGISDGMKLGSNARAALMTRAIHEISRLGIAMGAKPETFSGLSGIGDLIVTCSTNLSRNRRCGLMIGLGMTAEEAVEKVGSVVEGYYTSDAVYDLARRLDVEMPICRATRSVLKGKLDPEKAVRMLMSRDKKDELD